MEKEEDEEEGRGSVEDFRHWGGRGGGWGGLAAEMHAALLATKETCLLTLILHTATSRIFRKGGERRCREMKGKKVGGRRDAERCWVKRQTDRRWTAKVGKSQLENTQRLKINCWDTCTLKLWKTDSILLLSTVKISILSALVMMFTVLSAK